MRPRPRCWPLVLVLLLPLHRLEAQDAQPLKRPAIGGHTFLSSDLVPDPFVRGYVRQTLGLARAVDVEFPLGIIGDDTLALLQGDLTFAVLDFEYQHAVKDWLAVRGRFNLRSRLGTSGSSLLAEGVQLNTGFEFGWLVRLLATDRIMFSGTVDVSRQSLTVIDFRGFLEDLLAGTGNAQLADAIPTVRTTGGLRLAWGVSKLLGVNGVFEGGYGDAPRRNDAGDFIYRASVNADLDLGAVSAVPIGIGLGYTQSSIVDEVDADSDTRTLVLRVGFTGRQDFIIAVDVVGNALRDASLAKTVKAMGALLTMRYYF